jgi:hypothetical protein
MTTGTPSITEADLSADVAMGRVHGGYFSDPAMAEGFLATADDREKAGIEPSESGYTIPLTFPIFRGRRPGAAA